jgi:anti-sigma-K factor RskA
MTIDCRQAELVAGALALGEASDSERQGYRKHLAGCPECVDVLGGEREIERAMEIVAQARDDERWEPVARVEPAARRRSFANVWRFAAACAAALVVAFIGVRAFYPTALQHTGTVSALAIHPSQRDERAVAVLGTTSTGHFPTNHAESLTVFPATSAATHAASFEVRIDKDGAPRSCTITKPSGNGELDRAICRAALRVAQKP